MPETAALVERIAAFVDQQRLLSAGPVVVALSGGPDSLVLLHVLADLATPRGWRLMAAHFDHGLRPEAAGEVATVRALAAARGVPLRSGHGPVTPDGSGVEAAARQARYRFLAAVAADLGGAPVAVGHTQDDQAETLLLRLARGTGLTGLAAMRPLTHLRPSVWGAPDDAGPALLVVRPLLTTSRAEVEAELARRGLTPLRDPSNADLVYARNRLRHHLLPAWQALDPAIGARLARTADLVADDEAVLAALVDERWQHLAEPATGSQQPGVALARAGFLAEPVALRRRLLRRAVAALSRQTPTLATIEAAQVIAAGPAGGQADLASGVRLTVEADRLWFGATPAPPHGPWMTPGSSVPLVIDGETALPGSGWTIVCRRLAADACPIPLDRHHVHLAPALASATLRLRTRRPGDRLALPASGHQTLSDFFINRKVPRATRDGVPLLVAGETILWVVGHRGGSSFAPIPSAPVLCCQVTRAAP